MQKFIHNVALLASFIVLSAGLWQDWGVGLTIKRMFISYLGFFAVGSCLFLAFRTASRPDSEPRGTEGPKTGRRGSGS